MSAIDAPLCRLCGKEHWQRAGCDFGKNTKANVAAAPRKTSAKQTNAEKVTPGKRKTAPKAKRRKEK